MFGSTSTIWLLILLHQTTGIVLISNHLKVALVEVEPFVSKDSNGNARGFLVDVMRELLDRVNTSGTQKVTYDTHWITLSNASSESDMWDAVRQQMLSGETDLALVPLVDTAGWNGVIQLSQPYLLAPFLPLVSQVALGPKTDGATVLDKLRQGKLKSVYVAGSSMAGLIENDQRAPLNNLRNSTNLRSNQSQVSTYNDGLARVKDAPDQVAFFGNELRLKPFVQQARQCDLVLDYESTVGLGAFTLPLSLYVQSQPLISSINTNLLRMRQDGTVVGLKNKWWPDASCKQAIKGANILNNLENYY